MSLAAQWMVLCDAEKHHSRDGREIISDWSLFVYANILLSNPPNFCYFVNTLAVSWLASVVVVMLLNAGRRRLVLLVVEARSGRCARSTQEGA